MSLAELFCESALFQRSTSLGIELRHGSSQLPYNSVMLQGADPLIKGRLSDRHERSAEITLRPFPAFGMLFRCHEQPQKPIYKALSAIRDYRGGFRIEDSIFADDVQEIPVLVGIQSV